jgi:hypothetical protein
MKKALASSKAKPSGEAVAEVQPPTSHCSSVRERGKPPSFQIETVCLCLLQGAQRLVRYPEGIRGTVCSYVKHLQVLHSNCLLIATGASWYTSNREIHEDLVVPYFEVYIRALSESYASS